MPIEQNDTTPLAPTVRPNDRVDVVNKRTLPLNTDEIPYTFFTGLGR